MDQSYLQNILNQVSCGTMDVREAMEQLKDLPFQDLGFANIDQHRNIRVGQAETVYCEGKTPEQVAVIMDKMREKNSNILGTRASAEVFQKVKDIVPEAVYYPEARMISVIKHKKEILTENIIAVVTAGTSDIPAAEEAAITAEALGNPVDRIYDVGVAGIHRLLSKLDRLQAANVVIVVAGMEGALASVVGGLVSKPVIAVPTSVGYGASFGGIAALLAMLNSCSAGVAVVNIDNGFGAASLASRINQL
ncbi:MAG: nickel pincer cofactor biosynthesis protein LarB [Eubacteriales bacterium]|nr:nickel pincer cofactor biosynthesis protein LarB [Eubacteriales bacterium]MDD3199589.1 nickel pincer cofactor biosynthesis protein LarB [Eubacteriales bacterium]MDD4629301.1 nickel pincer cofactor biosynthesis protein LarB [Eubacteriales bacterium]